MEALYVYTLNPKLISISCLLITSTVNLVVYLCYIQPAGRQLEQVEM
jgi:hypothetical protein